MNPYNAETDYHLAVAWEAGHLAALEEVLKIAENKPHPWRGTIEDAVHQATQKADAA